MSTREPGRGTVGLVLAGLLALAAVVVALAPFHDPVARPGATPDAFSVACGPPVVAALHGRSVASIGGTERVVTQYERSVLARGDQDGLTVACRRRARGRLLISTAGLGGAALALILVRRRSRASTVDQSSLVPA